MKVKKVGITFLVLGLIMTASFAAGAYARADAEKSSYIIVSGKDITIISAARSSDTEELASQCGYDTDEYIIETTDCGEYTAVELFPAMDYSLSVDGETLIGRATGGTVGALLEERGVTLGEEDILSVSPELEVSDGIEIKISRVTYGEDIKEEPLLHSTEYIDSADLCRGEEKTVSEGRDGVRKLTYSVRYVDGEEDSRKLVEDETVTEPTPTVIARGIKETPKPVEQNKTSPSKTTAAATKSESDHTKSTTSSQAPSENKTTSGSTVTVGDGVITASSGAEYAYAGKLSMKATAYSYNAGGYTSSGAPAQVGIVAALPSTLAPGTRVYIVSDDGKYTYGPAVVGDIPGSDVIDLFFETEYECRQFGIRQVTVYVLS